MYSHDLEHEDLPCSSPCFPCCPASPLSISFPSPTLPGAVSVYVGEVREWEKKPVGEEVEKEQVTSESYSAFTEFFLAAACRG